ncbi:uncharacterized protein LOC141608726 [Silene latifolia]|uniref:uncharacterized protein LOC141608726 n=1 Tax=Silene latifolia TaxID=37657 RepID=UPI003D76FDBA
MDTRTLTCKVLILRIIWLYFKKFLLQKMGTINGLLSNYDRVKELKAFDETKLGVKGVADSGSKTLPKMFIRPEDELSEEHETPCVNLQVPVISLQGIESKDVRDEIVKQVLHASEKWGFFQVVNHGIPLEVLEKTLQGNKMFHEQDNEVKKLFYTRDRTKPVLYVSNYDLYLSRAANWRDTLAIVNPYPGFLDTNEIPEICRDVMVDYINQVMKLGDTLLELLSMGLGLKPSFLKEEMECNQGWSLGNQYYPPCPAPELTLGTSKHSDPSFLTILLQDHIGGLQVLHQNQWVNVEPIPGTLVVNIGDILQIISNDKLKSVFHRVTANLVGPRVSTAVFLKGSHSSTKLYGPIKELLSQDHPPVYKEFTLREFHTHFFNRPLNGSRFEHVKAESHADVNYCICIKARHNRFVSGLGRFVSLIGKTSMDPAHACALNSISITKQKKKKNCKYSKMSNQLSYDRTNDLKAFDERKTGVKGLLDEPPTGEIQVPSIFIRPLEDRSKDLTTCPENITIPIIDLTHVNQDGYSSKPEIVKEMLSASETWGFFQVVNHGIPIEVLNNMIDGTRMFHEQDDEVKKQFYSRDRTKVVTYNTNYDFYKSKAANWRDSLSVNTSITGEFDSQDLPSICRESILEYLKHTIKLGDLILELLSLSLGLKQDYLSNLESNQAWNFACHYYPSCPEPELTLGTSKHTDASIITLLLQDHIGGLQVLHDDQWVNVTPHPGALIVNIGDLLQIISNDKLKSVSHRVIAQTIGPRVSIALFFKGLFSSPEKYGPIKELLSEENQPIYKDFTLEEFYTHFFSRPVDQNGLEYFKL